MFVQNMPTLAVAMVVAREKKKGLLYIPGGWIQKEF